MRNRIVLSLVVLAVAITLWPSAASAQPYGPAPQSPPQNRYPSNVGSRSFTFDVQGRVVARQQGSFQLLVTRVNSGDIRRGETLWIEQTSNTRISNHGQYTRFGALRRGQIVSVQGQVHRQRGARTYSSTSITIM